MSDNNVEEALQRYQEGFGDLDHGLDSIWVNLFYRTRDQPTRRWSYESKIIDHRYAARLTNVQHSGQELVKYAKNIHTLSLTQYDEGQDGDEWDEQYETWKINEEDVSRYPRMPFSDWIRVVFERIRRVESEMYGAVHTSFIGTTKWGTIAEIRMIGEVGGNVTNTDYNAIFVEHDTMIHAKKPRHDACINNRVVDCERVKCYW